MEGILKTREELEEECKHPGYLVDSHVDGNGNIQYAECQDCGYLDTGNGEILG